MLFADIVHAIHPYLMKDADVPTFMRNLIQMLCDIPERDWSTKKDPSSTQANKDASLYKFYKNGPTKQLAKAMLGRLTKENFVEAIYYDEDHNGRTDEVIGALSQAIRPFAPDIAKENLGDVLFGFFQKALEYIVNPEMENDRKLAQAQTVSQSAKGKFGAGLLEDCGHICSKPGCGKHLQTVTDTKQAVNDYEIAMIRSGKANYENVIPLCHDCFQSYSLQHTRMDEKELQSVKRIQAQARSARDTLDEMAIESGIRQVLENLSTAKPADLAQLNYEALSVPSKINEENHMFLVHQVLEHVTKYYLYIEKVMRGLAKQKHFDDNLLRAQIRAAYKKLQANKQSPEEIYQALSDRLRGITKQDILFCGIVISCFVQSCEVFDAIAE